MKIAIVGAGNMGGAIARGLAQCAEYEIMVSNPTVEKLNVLQRECPSLHVTCDNKEAVKDAHCIILAVKPWILPCVIEELRAVYNPAKQMLVSIVGGLSLEKFDEMLGEPNATLFHIIPDTAIAVGKGMTFIAGLRCTAEQQHAVQAMFACMGESVVIEERLMGAATALSSCGIAYAYKYVQACVQAGVQLGFYPHQALQYTIATVEGAMELLKRNGTLPQQEIDKVTTPGGMTIKGINSLEATGFTSSVISAILAPLKP